MAAQNHLNNSHQPSFPTLMAPHSIQPSFLLSSVASLENVSNSHQPSFPTWTMPASSLPSFSLPSVLPQALVLGRSSSTPGPSTLTLLEPGNVDRVPPSFLVLMMPQSNQLLFSLPSVQPQALVPGPSWSAPGPSTAQLSLPQSFGTRIPEHLYKNRLQEYVQASPEMPLPSYQTTNEGSAHAPKFRSTVLVGGHYYTSRNVFSVRKAAEQAKLAYEEIVAKIKDEESKLLDLSQQAGEPRHHHETRRKRLIRSSGEIPIVWRLVAVFLLSQASPRVASPFLFSQPSLSVL